MATVRMYRRHWVADYYDANQRRRIERPVGREGRALPGSLDLDGHPHPGMNTALKMMGAL